MIKVEIKNAAKKSADLYLFDSIGKGYFGGIGAQDVVDSLDQCAGMDEICLHVNSPGGDVFEGYAIYNILKNCKMTVNASIEGVAASAASFIVMGCKSIIMAETSYLMIHNAQAVAMGDGAGLRTMADKLDQHTKTIAKIYADRSGNTVDKMLEAMDAETWYTAADAKKIGLCDSIDRNLKMAAFVEPGRFKNAPKELIANKAQRLELARAKGKSLLNRAALLNL